MQTYWLRKLRRGVTMKSNGYDGDGIPQWLLHDAGRNTFFVIGWPEYEMLSRWHLGDPKLIIEAVNKETTLHIEMQDFENLEGFLYRNYLVEQRWRSIYQKAKEQKLIKSENIVYWFLRYYLFFRIPLFHPDKILTRTKIVGAFLFNRYTVYAMLFLGFIAVYQIGTQWENFTHTFSSIFSWSGLISYFFVFTVIKFFHELGHAYMCKQYGVSVPTIGVAFLVFWPVLYTDTTQSWSLPRHQRLRIALAGMWVETYFTIIAALIWSNVHNVTIQMICYVTVAINWVSTLLINVSPFMRFDGYYVLSDFLNVPNLQTRSFALARWQIRNWLFGWKEPLQEEFSKKMHWILVSYALITWVYRLVIYFGIALLVYHYFFKMVGIILFALEIYLFIFRPLAQEFQVWYDLKNQFTFNIRTKVSLACSILFLFLMFLPLNQGVKMNATLSYKHEFLYATQDAIVQGSLPSIGSAVHAGQLLVELKSTELEYNLKKTKLEYDKLQAEARRAGLNPIYNNEATLIAAKLAEKKKQYEIFQLLQEKLFIKAPFTGEIGDIAPDLHPGVVVMKNTWIIDVIDPSRLTVEAFVEQVDQDAIRPGVKGVFYPENLALPEVPVFVLAIEPGNVEQLSWRFSNQTTGIRKEDLGVATPSYHASDVGGKIPTNLSEKGQFVPVDTIYRVLLAPEKNVELNQIEIGTVILETEAKSFAFRLFYKIKRILSQESGF